MQYRTIVWMLLAAPMLSGCLAQSQIQSKYMRSQDDCREETSRLFESSTPLPPGPQGQAIVTSHFSECMNKAGWRLNTPRPVQTAQNPPTGSPSTNPSAALSARAPAAASQNTVPAQQPVYRVVQNPPSGAPSTNPSAAAARTARPQPAVMTKPTASASTLQGSPAATSGLPSAPAPSATYPNGFSAGRNF